MSEIEKKEVTNEELLQHLKRVEEQTKETQNALVRMRRFMAWRLVLLVAVVLLPVLALPFFLREFLSSYIGAFEALL